ncbi:unnamed protein product [Symbiodinium natans]|uniref:Uncharacterized protein n=1 Tax=Symbiodinium natans TaxID=878477 RepID=A0A812JHI2_9DINO|nr:unnamed protein product [Symbiodinium natans]
MAIRGLVFASMLAVAAAIVCPPELLQGAPVGRTEGSTCGGTCNTHGSCAAGLVCKEPSTPFLGVRPAGLCISAANRLALDSSDIQPVIKEAVQLLNGQLRNSIYMMVPIAVLGAEKKHTPQGVVRRAQLYDLSLALVSSTCQNDGRHSPLDLSCQPQHVVNPMNLDLIVQEKDSQYTLLGHSSIDRPMPVPLRI